MDKKATGAQETATLNTDGETESPAKHAPTAGKKGKPQSQGQKKRGGRKTAKAKQLSEANNTSKRSFPAIPLEDALAIPEAFRKVGNASEYPSDLIARAVGCSSSNSHKFYTLAAASRDYNLTTGGRYSKNMTLLELGKDVVLARKPEEEYRAKLRAFLSVEPFAQFFQRCPRLSLMPKDKYLTNLLEQDLHLPESQHKEFLRLLHANSKYLNFTDDTVASDAGLASPSSEGSRSSDSTALTVSQSRQLS